MKRTFETNIGVNILGFPMYYQSIIFQEDNKFLKKNDLHFSNSIITQR